MRKRMESKIQRLTSNISNFISRFAGTKYPCRRGNLAQSNRRIFERLVTFKTKTLSDDRVVIRAGGN